MLFVAILLAGTLGVQADTLPPPSGLWRLGELLAAIEAKSPELAAARAEQLAAEARIGPVSRPPDPRLQLGLMNRSLPSLGKRSVVAMDQLQLVQMVPLPGKLSAGAAVARANAKAAAVGIEQRRRELRLRATEDFFELAQVDRSVTVLQHSGQLLRELEGAVRAMYSVGSGRQADVLRAQIELAKLDEELTSMRAMRSAAAARLNAMLLRPTEAPFAAAPACLPDSLPSTEALLEAALREAPTLQAGAAKLAAAQAANRLAGLERWPDLELGVAYGQQPMPAEPGTERMLSFMVGVTLPLWSGSRQGAMRREALAMRSAAEAELRAAEVEARSRIAELLAAFQKARHLRQLYHGTILPQARVAATSALAGYRSGGMNLDSVLEAHLTVSSYELQLIKLDAEQARAVSGLEALTGLALMESTSGGAR